jgi:hypothetical protein
MDEIITVGLDLAKSIFQVHRIDKDGRVCWFAACCDDRRCCRSFEHSPLA